MDIENDPLAGLKLIASTYGIPPEITERLVGGISDMADAHIDRTRSAEIANLLAAAESATKIGETRVADMLIVEVRTIMGFYEEEPGSDTSTGEGAQA